MGYGGPRVAFYTQSQYDNFTASIKKEDAARMRELCGREKAAADVAEEHTRLEAFRAAERTKAEDRAREQAAFDACVEQRRKKGSRTPSTAPMRRSMADTAALKARMARTSELAKPKQYPEAMCGAGTYGCVMHQRTHTVIYPEGRNGAVYCPGVDRDRRVPERPALTASLPPWVGSYSTHRKAAQVEDYEGDDARELRREGPQRSLTETTARRGIIESMAQRHAEEAAAGRNVGEQAPCAVEDADVEGHARGFRGGDAAHSDEDDLPSVFSHGSSNGPIAATGAPHLEWHSTKDDVTRHLTLYGGAMTAPRRRTQYPPVASLTLPELSSRLVRMQYPKFQ